MKKYNEALRNLREDRDYKQETIAEVLNITRQQYQLYESGKKTIRSGAYKNLMYLLQCFR